MAKKICENDLTYQHLLKAHQRDNNNGIRALLSEKMQNGKVRVTNRRKIINKILNPPVFHIRLNELVCS